jgi:hypothetical protein
MICESRVETTEGETDGDIEAPSQLVVKFDPLDATFNGAFGEDGETFGGGWRPNPGADETANVPYDISGRRMR